MKEVIPFGLVLEDRFELSKKYKLIEPCAGFWRLTKKTRKYYEPISFIRYLQGQLEAPNKISETPKTVSEQKEDIRETIINELTLL